ncbi:hypothetical protein B0H19DRAFT_1183705 [Mycena capillaripes]|nr:hypothetical protein B0H19DRAFT_1183705 [Mycena capillaripes]
MTPSHIQGSREPILPLELERAIFEIAALARPTSIPNLMLIAWRVNHWVEPLLYRVVLLCSTLRGVVLGFPVFTAEILLRVIANKPTDFLGRSVKHLFVDYAASPSELAEILAACTGVTNLFGQFVTNPHMQALDALRCVQRLTIDHRALFRANIVDLATSLFRTVTHLELLDLTDMEDGPGICARLALLPHLTHLAINNTMHNVVSHAGLRADIRLQCIVFLGSDWDAMANNSPLLDDPRFVFLSQTKDYRCDWMSGVKDAEDFWVRADGFIARRRRGDVDRKRFRISDTDDKWKN